MTAIVVFAYWFNVFAKFAICRRKHHPGEFEAQEGSAGVSSSGSGSTAPTEGAGSHTARKTTKPQDNQNGDAQADRYVVLVTVLQGPLVEGFFFVRSWC